MHPKLPGSVQRLPFIGRFIASRARRGMDRAFAARLQDARARGDHTEARHLEEQSYYEERFERAEADVEHTRSLLHAAQRARVPVPRHPCMDSRDPEAENEHWAFSNEVGRHYLTAAGVTLLRDALRRENAARWESRNRWIPLATVLTSMVVGILGALSGLVALLR